MIRPREEKAEVREVSLGGIAALPLGGHLGNNCTGEQIVPLHTANLACRAAPFTWKFFSCLMQRPFP